MNNNLKLQSRRPRRLAMRCRQSFDLTLRQSKAISGSSAIKQKKPERIFSTKNDALYQSEGLRM